MSFVLALAATFATDAHACAMPHEMVAVAAPQSDRVATTTLADVFAEIDGVEVKAATTANPKSVDNATRAPATAIPEVTAPTAPPVARPST